MTDDTSQSNHAPYLNFTPPGTPELTPVMKVLEKHLTLIHGPLRATQENNKDIHLYMACPNCLEVDGAEELSRRYLAVNVSKYAEREIDLCGFCMKEGEYFRISDLLAMETLEERGHQRNEKIVHRPAPQVILLAAAEEKFMERDHLGRLVPKGPGTVIPVHKLPPDHPAVKYLEYRGFNPLALWNQFRCSYCEEERHDIRHRKLLNGFAATPQGRIVFFIDVEGMAAGWQARIMEKDYKDERYYYHPYRKEWAVMMEQKDGEWRNLLAFKEWEPVKYIIALGCRKSSYLLGFDAALAHSSKHFDPGGHRYLMLTEGVFDAARLGLPSAAMMGASLSNGQAALIAKYFRRVLYFGHNDEAGIKAAEKVKQTLFHRHPSIMVDVHFPLPNYKDVAEMPEEEAREFKTAAINGRYA